MGLVPSLFEPMLLGMDRDSTDADPHESLLSFVVPAHNEEAVLAETLGALYRAAREVGEPFEVVVAADSCTDRTAEIAREHGARVIEVAHRQISRTRNAGAAATHGERLIFIDADTQVTPELIAAALRALDAGALGGGAHVVFEGRQSLGVRVLVGSFMWILHRLRVAPGCFFFCRRADFEALGGFGREDYAGEEVWLSFAFQRRGRFVALKEQVVTSSRKLRTHSTAEIFAAFMRPLWMGRAAFRAREGLGLWYSDRRPDPGDRRS